MVDARDLKSLGRFSREGSSPSVRTNKIRRFLIFGTRPYRELGAGPHTVRNFSDARALGPGDLGVGRAAPRSSYSAGCNIMPVKARATASATASSSKWSRPCTASIVPTRSRNCERFSIGTCLAAAITAVRQKMKSFAPRGLQTDNHAVPPPNVRFRGRYWG